MQCLNPIVADMYHDRVDGKATLKNFRNLQALAKERGDTYVFNLLEKGYRNNIKSDVEVVLLPCRKCINCQLNRSREWAMRNTLESNLYDDDSKLFITLTYNDDSLLLPSRCFSVKNKKTGKEIDIPKLNLVDVQKFLKRLRKHYSQYHIRYYLAGEYGSKTLRPHYHILLYGLPLKAIDDLELLYENQNGKYYNSKFIEKKWELGFVNITTFSDYTACYTSRYCTKKQVSNSSLNYCFANSCIPHYGMSL